MQNAENILEFFELYKEETEAKIQQGIEKNRKGIANITVLDENGNPLSGEIKIRQKNHEFRFGTNIFMLDQLESEEKNELYKKYIKDVFNMVTLPFYWDALEPKKGETRYAKDSIPIYRRPPIDRCIEFCDSEGIEPREHALAYDHFFPQWLSNSTVDEVKSEYERRCREISERYAEKIRTIEVTNETWWHDGVTSIYDEPDFVEYSFNIAKKYFPTNELVINEWTNIWSSEARTRDRYYMQIDGLLLRNTPIDSIGLQYHMFPGKKEYYEATRCFYNPKQLYKIMDLYSRFGKPLQVTEITIPCYSNDEKDEMLQAEILRQLYSIWFSHENVEQIIYWNLADGYAAFTEAGNMTQGENYFYGGLIRYDFTEKPSYLMLKDLICNIWNTKEDKKIQDGFVSFNGFYGDYDLEISVGDKIYHREMALKKNQKNELVIEL